MDDRDCVGGADFRLGIGAKLDGFNFQRGKCSAVQPFIEREQPIAAGMGVGADQEVSEEASRSVIKLLAPSLGIGLESSTGRAPDGFIQIPIDRDSVFFQKQADKVFGATRGGNEFGEDRGGDDKVSTFEGRIQGGLRVATEGSVAVPQGDDDVGIDGR